MQQPVHVRGGKWSARRGEVAPSWAHTTKGLRAKWGISTRSCCRLMGNWPRCKSPFTTICVIKGAFPTPSFTHGGFLPCDFRLLNPVEIPLWEGGKKKRTSREIPVLQKSASSWKTAQLLYYGKSQGNRWHGKNYSGIFFRQCDVFVQNLYFACSCLFFFFIFLALPSVSALLIRFFRAF